MKQRVRFSTLADKSLYNMPLIHAALELPRKALTGDRTANPVIETKMVPQISQNVKLFVQLFITV